ncbi:MAG: hypothetical protein JSS69_00465 [Acidobacteria bacterium]|nr:hypothetical protein [Acidobacteriota bacterium]MBS1864365.1 hypothetical protein [Acidobacteriota bacterium]
MKKTGFAVLILATGCSFGAMQVNAQGPAGVGATQAAASSSNSSGSSHSLNPIKWIKKDKSSSNVAAPSADQNKRLTALLQQNGVLPKDGDVSSSCSVFKNVSDCVAALHASHNVGVDFNCVRADVTGVQTSADLSGCKGPVGDKAVSLQDALKRLKPEADAKAEAKNAEKQAKDDLKEVGA